MAARTGMTSLIRRLRQMCETGASDYTLDGATYWTDDDLQGRLDEARRQVLQVALVPRPSYISGDNVYKRYEIPRSVGNAVEGVAGGTAIFRVYDSTGVDVTDTYTFNEHDLTVEFTVDQEGVALYWDGYAYDLQAAAREIWLSKAAHAHMAINFSADGRKFDREALYQHCMEQAKVYGYSSGAGGAAKLQTSRLVRTDLNWGGR